MATLPAGTILQIEAEIRLPADATEQHIWQWLHYNLFQSGGISRENPLFHEAPEEWANSLDWKDTEMIGTREEFDIRVDADGTKHYRVRFHRKLRGVAA